MDNMLLKIEHKELTREIRKPRNEWKQKHKPNLGGYSDKGKTI